MKAASKSKNTIRAGFGLALGALLCVALFAFWNARAARGTLQRVDHTRQVQSTLERWLRVMVDAETGSRGYLMAGDDFFLEQFEPSIEASATLFKSLRELTRDDEVQQQNLDRLRVLADQKIAWLRDRIAQREQDPLTSPSNGADARRGKVIMDDIRKVVSEMEGLEEQQLRSRTIMAQTQFDSTMQVALLAMVVVFLAVTAAGWLVLRDFDFREEARLEVERARTHAEGIVNTVREPLVVLDGALRARSVNRSFGEVFETPAEEVQGQPFFEAARGAWKSERLEQAVRDALKNGTRFADLEIEHDFPLLGRRIMLINGQKLPEPGESAGAVLLAIEDVTDRRRAEEALRNSEERMRLLVESVEEYAIFMLDLEGRIATWNAGAERLKGYRMDEALGRPFSIFFTPEDIAAGRPEQLMEEARKLGRAEDEGWRMRKDGTRFYANGVINAIRGKDGELRGFAKVTRDVTARKSAEKIHLQFRALFESLPGLFLVLTPDLRIVAASDAFLEATMTTREAILNRGLFEVFPDNPDDTGAGAVANVGASIQRVLQTGTPDTMAIQRYDVRDPEGRFVERYWSPINSAVFGLDRSIEYVIHRVEDVTDFMKGQQQTDGLIARMEQVQAEVFRSTQKVQAANEELREANSELEAFSYSVSHDLRAPLRHIDGFADMLSKRVGSTLDDTSQRFLRTISESAKRMGTLIDDLLVFSRMARAEMKLRPISLADTLRAAQAELRPEMIGRNIEWRIGDLPNVWADPALVRLVLTNLISNAIKYTRPRDPAKIEIGMVPGEEIDRQIAFFVRDNGVGFDMTYVEKLFGVFQRLHRADEFEGTGIGLANVRRIISRHHGRVWAEGKVGVGSTFFFSLPKEPVLSTALA